MKGAELKKKKDSELVKLLRDKRAELREFHFNTSTGRNNVHLGANLRKDVARILTELRARTS